MFDLDNVVKKRYFQLRIQGNKNKMVLNIEPPKLKVLKRITKLEKTSSIDEMVNLMKIILSKNKENRNVDELVEELNYDQMQAILQAYFEWLKDIKSSKN